MSNSCNNTLIVKGSEEALKNFIKFNIGYPAIYSESTMQKCFCFNSLVPTPLSVVEFGYDKSDELSEEVKRNACKGKTLFPIDGYYWNIANWGVKWDIYNDKLTEKDFEWSDDKKCISIFFITAWYPPSLWVKNIGKLFKNLDIHLSYYEPRMLLYGDLYSVNGKFKHKKYSKRKIKKLFKRGEL